MKEVSFCESIFQNHRVICYWENYRNIIEKFSKRIILESSEQVNIQVRVTRIIKLEATNLKKVVIFETKIFINPK